MKPLLLYTDGILNTYYLHTCTGKHLIINERDNKVVFTKDISHSIMDKGIVDKYLRQLGQPTTRQMDRQFKQDKLLKIKDK